ncbi:hypothetical protein [Streptomyces sp. KL2]|uniref:hypothetical protein n=1 Tax=Streptomyces sp. KL2 TaxID=3050126 RepID=UPI00397B815E
MPDVAKEGVVAGVDLAGSTNADQPAPGWIKPSSESRVHAPTARPDYAVQLFGYAFQVEGFLAAQGRHRDDRDRHEE